MRIRTSISGPKDLAFGLGGVAVLIAIWCGVTYGGLVKPLFLPPPTEVWRGITHFNELGWLFPAIWRSFLRVTVALLLVLVIGTPIGIAMGAYAPVDSALNRIMNAFKAVPPTGLIGLIILWFSVEEKAKIVFLFLGAIFYMILLVRNAVAAVPENLLVVARDIGASGGQMLRKVLLPGALPQIWEAVIVCNGIMWTYIVLAEYINSSQDQIGLGYLLQTGSRTYQSGQVYGTLILIGAIAYLSDWALRQVQRRFFAW
ncbi:MAG: ABC transporter permease [Verrucomicrobiaceae bacterium]|nr:MAG: ABC transporter permease [Verrucomicrobiaceae bacterium]